MNVRLKITCCNNCTDRYPGCHDVCKKYQNQKAARNEEGRKIWEAKLSDIMLDSMHQENVARTKRRFNIK